jgi:uncharacterized protein YecE (DUF72 family)
MEETNLPALERRMVRVGCVGWSIPGEFASRFPGEGTHLERYGQRFSAVEINSSFYRPHRPATYARWAASVPEGFRFAVKVPREITHRLRLAAESGEALDRFMGECGALGAKLGPLLLQLPPSLVFEEEREAAFFALLRARYAGSVVCEPRHASWFVPEAEEMLTRFRVARVAADPAVVAEAARPGGWPRLVYYRLHGSPRVYYSAYGEAALAAKAAKLVAATERSVEAWCIFDNTAAGAATGDALGVLELLKRLQTR